MNKLKKKTMKQLDSMSDAEFIYWLYINYGIEERVWEEITKEEYYKAIPSSVSEEQSIKYSDLVKTIELVFSGIEYKKEPIGLGIWDMLNGKKAEEYKYYKSTKTQRVLCVSAAMADYIHERGLGGLIHG